MKKRLMTAMMGSISEIFETMFFLPLEFPEDIRAEERLGSSEKGVLTCMIRFKGHLTGNLFLIIPASLSIQLTADFLGEEIDTLSKDQIIGTIKEIINMIAGNAFLKYDDNMVFDLGIPEMIGSQGTINEPDSDEPIFIDVKTPDEQFVIKIALRK